MTVYIFLGPTLSPAEARAELDAVYLPPVAQGDVYRIARRRPRAIGIVDGYFERVPAVWHKEILWAMSEGVHVFGSASMGALRAAELEAFGMEGVGAIFEAYRDGSLTADDEVAVAHGTVEDGFRVTSEAMVNIRATLAAGQAAGVIGAATHLALIEIGRALFYPDRSWPRLLQGAAEARLPADELDRLRGWLPSGRVDQKRDDALALLRMLRERLREGLDRKHVRYTFERTDIWEEVRTTGGESPARTGSDEALPRETLLEELRLDPMGAAIQDGALMRLLALDEARRHRLAVSAEQLAATAARFRRERGLLTVLDLELWLEKNGLSREEFDRLIEDEACLEWVRLLTRSEATELLVDQLRVSGDLLRLTAMAEEKQHLLEAAGLENPALGETGLSEAALRAWYAKERLGRLLPLDNTDHAHAAGFPDEESFERALVRDFLYRRGR